MKAKTLYQSKDTANVKVFADKRTGRKLYSPDLSMRGHKKENQLITSRSHFQTHNADLFHLVLRGLNNVYKDLNWQDLRINCVPNSKILHWSKSKALADNKINKKEILIFGLGRIDNIVGTGENAGYQNFLLFPQQFQSPLLQGR